MIGTRMVIFDLDGTLAEVSHRRSLVESDGKDWDAFFAAMHLDTPRAVIVELYGILGESGRFEMVIVTGRPERYRAPTEAWLSSHEIKSDRLLMRRDGDRREDAIVKQEFLMGLRAGGKQVFIAVDDRDSVVAMWRREGITCLQCAPGGF